MKLQSHFPWANEFIKGVSFFFFFSKSLPSYLYPSGVEDPQQDGPPSIAEVLLQLTDVIVVTVTADVVDIDEELTGQDTAHTLKVTARRKRNWSGK